MHPSTHASIHQIDRLETAEALFRRSLAVDEGSAHTRRRLADVLSAQNAIADAVNEYKKVIDAYKAKSLQPTAVAEAMTANAAAAAAAAEDAEKGECLEAIGQCEKLLKSLGRVDEIKPLLQLQQTLA